MKGLTNTNVGKWATVARSDDSTGRPLRCRAYARAISAGRLSRCSSTPRSLRSVARAAADTATGISQERRDSVAPGRSHGSAGYHPQADRLVAHDNKKVDLIEWAKFNRKFLVGHDLVATGTTGVML